jgi:phage/plasmid-like protein (TIGR03299 family)
MAHMVESMFYVGKEPWHGLGTPIPADKQISVREAIVAAKLDWRVELRPLYTEKPDGGAKSGILDHYAVCRTSDNAFLGLVGPDYVPLQNEEALKWFQPFLDFDSATLETAGSLNGGRQVWALAKIRDSKMDVGKEDPVAHYILLSNAHDGSIAVRVGFTPIRVVCNNTLTLAHYSKASQLLRVRHTSGLHYNLELIREIMNVAGREFSATVAQYRRLQKRGIDSSGLERYVRVVFSLPEDKGGKELIPNIIYLFENGRGSKEAGRTYWGAYNAVTEYLNYFRGRTQDNTLSSLWFGEGSRISRLALTTALKMAA